MTPKLSIVVPVYNVEIYLQECLDSIINQTFKDIEIIIVNDCSPDNSESIILEYISKDSRIKYIKHDKNLGLGGARNTGITNATGEWIAFVDSDDYINLNTYEVMLSLIEKHQADLGVFSAIKFDDSTKKETSDPYFDSNIGTLTTINYQNFYHISSATAWNKVFRRSDLIDNSLAFPEHLKHEDEEFWFKYIATIEPSVIGNDEEFYHYRQRSASIMSNSNFKLDLPQIALNLYNFLKQNNLLETYRTTFITHLINYIVYWTYLIPSFTKKDSVKYLQEIKHILNLMQPTTSELQQNPTMFYIYTTKQINENSVMFLSQLQESQPIQYDKWYLFGQLSKKQKIKKIIVVISKKLKLYPILKKTYNLIKK